MRQEFNGPWESKRGGEEGRGGGIRKLETTTSSSLKIRCPLFRTDDLGDARNCRKLGREIGRAVRRDILAFPRVCDSCFDDERIRSIQTKMIEINRMGEEKLTEAASKIGKILTDRRPSPYISRFNDP